MNFFTAILRTVFRIFNQPNNPDASFCLLCDYLLVVFITFMYINVIPQYSQRYLTRFENMLKTITKLK